ncbi:hypothetical protein [Cohnella sp.]|uniref:hypothetical protein n=1 Tax=Cohnella sp. TaxID=1883426 RepID=UPI003565FA0C
MINLYAHVYGTLSALGYPVREQGTYAPGDELPETHVTYFFVDSPNDSHADNEPTSTTTRIQVALYSRDPEIKQAANATLKDVMLPAGFLRVGGGDLPYNTATGHYGFRCDFRFYDMED